MQHKLSWISWLLEKEFFVFGLFSQLVQWSGGRRIVETHLSQSHSGFSVRPFQVRFPMSCSSFSTNDLGMVLAFVEVIFPWVGRVSRGAQLKRNVINFASFT